VVPHCPDNQLTDGAAVVSPPLPRSNFRDTLRRAQVRYRLNTSQGHDAVGRVGQFDKKIYNLIRTRTRDLAACIAPQPSTLQRDPILNAEDVTTC
jgi:hypothetical protein